MKSPITGKEMKLMVRKETMIFRKEELDYLYHYYFCEGSSEEFTDEVLDSLNLNQVYNQYRFKYNLPYPDEVRSIREQYDLSAAKMAEVLGFGINHYRLYEAGEVPSISNARLIQAAKDPVEFKKILLASGVFKDNALKKLLDRIDELRSSRADFHYNGLPQYLMGGLHNEKPGVYTGYATPCLKKLIALIVHFSSQLKPFKTRLNKLLFYADFVHYKRTGFGISGVSYKAIQMGPVPENFGSIFEYAAAEGHVEIVYQEFDNGGIGELFSASTPVDQTIFNKSEWESIDYVLEKFRNTSTNEIIRISHDEKAWLNNVKDKGKISYSYAFELIHA